MFSPHQRSFRRADTAVTRAASSNLPSYYTGLSHSSVFSSSPSKLCVHERLVAAELHVVFQYRDKHPQHHAANRALPHLPVEAGTSELWAPGWLQWPHAGQVTGAGLSRHLFRSGSCKNLGKLGNPVASALVSLFSAGQRHPLLLMALCAAMQVNIPSFPLMPWEEYGRAGTSLLRGPAVFF